MRCLYVCAINIICFFVFETFHIFHLFTILVSAGDILYLGHHVSGFGSSSKQVGILMISGTSPGIPQIETTMAGGGDAWSGGVRLTVPSPRLLNCKPL